MQIDYESPNARKTRYIFCYCFVLLGLILIIVAGPARDERGLLKDWQLRASIYGVVLLALLVFPTYNRITTVNTDLQLIEITDRLIWFLVIQRNSIHFDEVSNIILVQFSDLDDIRYHQVKIKTKSDNYIVMTRNDPHYSQLCEKQVADLSELLNVKLVQSSA